MYVGQWTIIDWPIDYWPVPPRQPEEEFVIPHPYPFAPVRGLDDVVAPDGHPINVESLDGRIERQGQ